MDPPERHPLGWREPREDRVPELRDAVLDQMGRREVSGGRLDFVGSGGRYDRPSSGEKLEVLRSEAGEGCYTDDFKILGQLLQKEGGDRLLLGGEFVMRPAVHFRPRRQDPVRRSAMILSRHPDAPVAGVLFELSEVKRGSYLRLDRDEQSVREMYGGINPTLERNGLAPGSGGRVVAGRDHKQTSGHGFVLRRTSLQEELIVGDFVRSADTHGSEERMSEGLRRVFKRVDEGLGRVVLYLLGIGGTLGVRLRGTAVVEEDVPILR
jgi:hypothetical protein